MSYCFLCHSLFYRKLYIAWYSYVYVVDSVYKSGYSQVVEPARAQPRIPSNSHIPLEQSYIFRILPPQKGLSLFSWLSTFLCPSYDFPSCVSSFDRNTRYKQVIYPYPEAISLLHFVQS